MLIHAYTVSKQGKGGNDDEEDHSVLAAIVPSIVQKVPEQSGIRHQHKNSSSNYCFHGFNLRQLSSAAVNEWLIAFIVRRFNIGE